jgi:hypothetical protein
MDPTAGRPVGFRFSYWSLAVRVTVMFEPEVTEAEPKLIELLFAVYAPGFTVMELEVADRVPSLILMVREPAEPSVKLNVPTPLVSVAGVGSVALLSLEVNTTVPL